MVFVCVSAAEVYDCCVCVCVCVCVRASPPYLFVNLQKLLHSHFLVLGNPEGSVDAPKAASSTVLVEEQVLMLYLHKRRAGGRHGILTHTNAHIYTHVHTYTHTHTQPKKRARSTTSAAPKSIHKSRISTERVKDKK